MSKEHQFIVLGLIAAILMGGGVTLYNRFFSPVEPSASLIKTSETPIANETIMVHVVGAVKKSGLYKLKEKSRMIDAVLAAQVLESADLDNLNLAESISDGQKIIVPYRKSAPAVSTDLLPACAAGGKVNLNTADEKELSALPGIGLSTARKIIHYRNTHGPFNTPEKLMEVPGIGKSKFDKLKDQITI